MLSAIIVAAGSSTRAGFDKLTARIGGRALVEFSLEAFSSPEAVLEIVLVGREATLSGMAEHARKFPKVCAVVPGGERRQDSVCAGLAAISPRATLVGVHDAARPLITPGEIVRVLEAARAAGAAALAAPVTDTLKRADEGRRVIGSLDRAGLYAMQTPQIFARELLEKAYREVSAQGLAITDEVSAVQSTGAPVVLVLAQQDNMKITFGRDLALAETILRQRRTDSAAAVPFR